MKDYSFGNYICALRMGLGLSQFQLGTLVGVSDKAVSKWENGDAKPRISTCHRLADVLGVSINELLSCNTTLPARKELDLMKTKLWNDAKKRLSIYEDESAAMCWSRFAAEKSALDKTDAILCFAVLSKIAEVAESQNTMIIETSQVSSSYVAWLLGATRVNPLPPHYRCLKCGKTVFSNGVVDGFDLPAKQCNCGSEMIRDGHNIPFEGFAKAMANKCGVDIHVSTSFKPTAAQIIKDFYRGKATVLPVIFTDDEYEWDSTPSEKYVVLTGRSDVPSVDESGCWNVDSADFWHWWKEEVVYTLISDNKIQSLQVIQEQTNTKMPNLTDLTCPQIAELLYQKRCLDSGHAASMTMQECQDLPHNFDLILKLDGFTLGTNVWLDQWESSDGKCSSSNGEKIVKEKRASILDIPAFRDDVWNDVNTALLQNGIQYNGLALEIMESARMGRYSALGTDQNMEIILKTLGLPEWYSEYLRNVKYLFPKGYCVSMLLIDIALEWYAINYPKYYGECVK